MDLIAALACLALDALLVVAFWLTTREPRPTPEPDDASDALNAIWDSPLGSVVACSHEALPEVPRVVPENYWREVWHDGCPNRGPMRRLNDFMAIEDGSSLRLFECCGCGVRVYAGLDAKRFVTTRAARPALNPVTITDGEVEEIRGAR